MRILIWVCILIGVAWLGYGQEQLTLVKHNGKKSISIDLNRIIEITTSQGICSGTVTRSGDSTLSIVGRLEVTKHLSIDTTLDVSIDQIWNLHVCRKADASKCPDKRRLAPTAFLSIVMVGASGYAIFALVNAVLASSNGAFLRVAAFGGTAAVVGSFLQLMHVRTNYSIYNWSIQP